MDSIIHNICEEIWNFDDTKLIRNKNQNHNVAHNYRRVIICEEYTACGKHLAIIFSILFEMINFIE